VDEQHKSKLEIHSQRFRSIIIELTDRRAKDSPIEKSSVTRHAYSFPTGTFTIRIDAFPELNQIARGDRVVYSDALNDEPFMLSFAGEVIRFRRDSVQGAAPTVTIIAASTFHRLSLVRVATGDLPPECRRSARQLLARLKDVCGIQDEVVVDKNVPDALSISEVSNMPAMSIIKHVLREKNLLLRCPRGDKLIIEPFERELERLRRGPIHHLGPDDIKSMTIRG
jgi:hypothetical protein